jgi:hypothetical protein
MSNYFDRLEQDMSKAVRRGAHLPWYRRLSTRPSRLLVVVVACLVATGSALAASGVFRTGTPVGPEVPPTPGAYAGAAIASSVRLLPLRVSDPDGGPPWGLRELKTTRGLMCLQVGRVVDGRLGALGQDGAFGNDGAFHPFSINFMSWAGCGTQDARGDAFLNEQLSAIPASALFGDQHHASGGCYARPHDRKSCPSTRRRDVYLGLLGPDATSITYATAGGQLTTMPTTGPDGAYLIVRAHQKEPCGLAQPVCLRSGGGGYMVGGPELEPGPAIRSVTYRNAPVCKLPAPTTPWPALPKRPPRCPAVGFAPISRARELTKAQLASPVTAHTEPARHYCERAEETRACDGPVPAGYRRLDMSGGPPQQLIVIAFTARVAVPNFDSHYEINTTNLEGSPNRHCPGKGAGTFGPTNRDLRAGQRVRYDLFVDTQCPGRVQVRVGFVTVNGPSGSMPVPGLPGQSAEIPVGHTDFLVP